MSYKIGSFNCLNFGIGSSKDLNVIANIIIKERFDVVALQEIKGKRPLDMLLQRLPNYWKGCNDFLVNDYAYIWNSRRIDLAKHNNKISQPYIYNNYKMEANMGYNRLLRNPYYARFHPVGGGAPFIEIRLINCHIRYGKSVIDIGDAGEIEKRRNEFKIVAKSILAKETDKRYGNNRPAYTIMLGDYNLNIRSSGATGAYLEESFVINNGNVLRNIFDSNKGIKTIKTSQIELTTLKENDDDNNKFANNYDHFSYDENRFKDTTIQCGRVDAISKYCNNNFAKYKKEVSDHLPISMKLDLKKK